EIDEWWDWAGDGWMLSESSLLLIDSSVSDIVGNGPRTTYLILDAFHSIPFQLLEDVGNYEAPARFRARLTHNGTWGADAHGRLGWLPPPTRYAVSLYDGALTYSFVAIWDDVPNNRWNPSEAGVQCSSCADGGSGTYLSSLHDRPFLPQQFGSSGR